ncbi:hypothetical protein DFH06DRAFT_1144054 [Mycena polygramma]|nr:hypothetical protein DFH06DRAFT_1144054 [Mycena polygramma]
MTVDGVLPRMLVERAQISVLGSADIYIGQRNAQKLWRRSPFCHGTQVCSKFTLRGECTIKSVAEILHSATYWQEVRRHAKLKRERAAARATSFSDGCSFPDDIVAAAHVYTFVPGSATPQTSVVQGNGSLLTVAPAGPSNGARQPWAASMKKPARDLDRLQADKDAELLARFKAPRKQQGAMPGTRKVRRPVDNDAAQLTHRKPLKKKGGQGKT